MDAGNAFWGHELCAGAALEQTGTFATGDDFRRIVAAPPLPRRLRAMGRTV